MTFVAALFTLGAVLAAFWALRRGTRNLSSTWPNIAAFVLALCSSIFTLVLVELPFKGSMVFYTVAIAQVIMLGYVLLQIRKPDLESNPSEMAFGAAVASVLLFLMNGLILPRSGTVFYDPAVLLDTLALCSVAVVALSHWLVGFALPLSPQVRAVYSQRLWSVLGKAGLLQVINFILLIVMTILLAIDPKAASLFGAVLGLVNFYLILFFRGWLVKGVARTAAEAEAAPIASKLQVPTHSPSASQSQQQPQKLGRP